MVNDKPVCRPCYVKKHAAICQGCHNAIDPEVQRVTYNNFNWHATQECFLCSCCSKCLIGQKFMPVEGMVFCSVEYVTGGGDPGSPLGSGTESPADHMGPEEGKDNPKE